MNKGRQRCTEKHKSILILSVASLVQTPHWTACNLLFRYFSVAHANSLKRRIKTQENIKLAVLYVWATESTRSHTRNTWRYGVKQEASLMARGANLQFRISPRGFVVQTLENQESASRNSQINFFQYMGTCSIHSSREQSNEPMWALSLNNISTWF